ncbi:MAG: EAL domain-containing protein [Methylococcales bacterium]|nr:EAL domain-containing protein [Methylococcales bacterium]
MQKAKILIVDDNPNNRLAIRTILKGVEAELHEADNGFDALSMSLEFNYALILLDIQMPEMDGYEVCEQLRADERTSEVPVIFLTAAFKENSDKMRGYKAGATDYLTKPIDDHILKAKVHVFLRIYQQHQQLQENNAALQLAASVFESQQGMIITDAENKIIRVNKAFSEITLYSAEEILGKDPSFLKSGRQDESFYCTMWQGINETGFWSGEIWNRRKNGEIYPEWLNITSVKINGVLSHYIGTMSDITEHKTAEAQIHRLAFYDPLTGLPNRRLLQERLQHAIERSVRDNELMALLMLDLDHFKPVNDSLGHLAGDQLLQQVAQRLSHRLRNSDMTARLGGDEFTVLLENITHIDDASDVAQEIITSLGEPFYLDLENKIEHKEVHIGVSIGISVFNHQIESSITPQVLMDNADIALYKAKASGRNCFAYFSEELTLAAKKHIELESTLRSILNRNELLVNYQPLVDMKTDKIIGAEALIRWLPLIPGFATPWHFIKFAEETGFIIAIGEWILLETCRQGKRWLDAGLPSLTLAVNVSPYQFCHSDMVESVKNALKQTQFPASSLELELTENGLMENNERTCAMLKDLRQLGVHISIDDFGTGYSSLSYLKYFPVSTLKIDKSFISEIPMKSDDMVIAETIISMGHTLGFTVLAEGVENQAQFDFLREKGCDKYQGFLKSKPLPAAEFEQLLRNTQK